MMEHPDNLDQSDSARRFTFRHHYMQPYHDTFLRYHTIDRELQSAGVRGRVLEVGCGSWGLAAWHPRLSVIGVDMRFAEARVANLIPLVADATRLPFPDGAFEAVVSSDMLEHIPPVNRRAAVEELIRVASRILVLGVPVGARAARQDQEMADYQRRRGETVDPMIAEHVENGLPTRMEMMEMFRAIDPSLKVRVIPNFNLRARKLSMFYTLARPERPTGAAAGLDYCVTWLVRLMRPLLRIGACYRDIYIVVRSA